MGNITRQKTQFLRDEISKKLQAGKTYKQIIEEMGLDDSTFFRHLKAIRDIETRIWGKIEIDNTRYRALSLLRSFEDTARVCTNIINNERTSNKDRIEACKTRDMAHAHILRLVEQGPMFQHLPEVKVIERRLADVKELTYTPEEKVDEPTYEPEQTQE